MIVPPDTAEFFQSSRLASVYKLTDVDPFPTYVCADTMFVMQAPVYCPLAANGNPLIVAVLPFAVAGYTTVNVAVTNRPILVYFPVGSISVNPAPDPSAGVHVPSSYQLSNSLVIPEAEVFAEKSMPFPAVPMTRFPVDKVTLPGSVIGVAIWLALITEEVVFNMV